MSQKIYINNLRYDVREDELRTLRERFGPLLSVAIPRNYETGAGRGYGFVEFSEEDNALKAIEELNKTFFRGRPLKALLARPRTSVPDR